MSNMKKKILFTILALWSWSSHVHGQAALIALLFGDQVASEDFNVSLELGWNFNQFQDLEQTRRKSAVNFGIAGNIKLSESWFLSPGVYFLSNRAYSFESYSLNTGNPSLDAEFVDKSGEGSVSYIDVPVLAWYQRGRWRLGAGPQLSFTTNSERLYEGNDVDFRQELKGQTENLEYGVMGALSYELGKVRKGKGLFIQLRYFQGLTDVYFDSVDSGNNRSNYIAIHFSLPFITDDLAEKKLHQD